MCDYLFCFCFFFINCWKIPPWFFVHLGLQYRHDLSQVDHTSDQYFICVFSCIVYDCSSTCSRLSMDFESENGHKIDHKIDPKNDVNLTCLLKPTWCNFGPKMAPKPFQDGPKMPPRWLQDGPKIPPRCLQNFQRCPQDASRCPQGAQDALKMPQDGPRRPKTSPRCPQDDPNCIKDAPKMPQGAFKMPQRWPQYAPRCSQNGPDSYFYRLNPHVPRLWTLASRRVPRRV